jgi:hypothetical protein
MTDTVTSQNIDLSSWNIMYISGHDEGFEVFTAMVMKSILTLVQMLTAS